MNIKLPKLEEWQKPVYDAIIESKGSGKIFTVKAKRQVGKSVLGIVILLWFAFNEPCTSILLEPTLVQGRRVFKQITKMLSKFGLVKKSNEQTMIIELRNGSSIIFKSAEQRERLRGETVTGIMIIDEGAYILDDIYEIVFPWVDAHKAPTLIISTPLFTSGYFYEFFKKGISGDDFCFSFDWSKYDTSKYLSPEKLAMYKEKLSPNKFLSEYLGEFITEGSYVFGNLNDCIGQRSYEPPYYLAIDWATGSEDGDYTWLTFADKDCNLTGYRFFGNVEPTKQINTISKIIRDNPSIKKIRVEKNSIGAVFLDFLKKESGRNDIEAFNTDNDSKRRIIEQLIEGMSNGRFKLVKNDEIINQFSHYAVEKTKKGYTYNAVSGYHDDGVMSCAMLYDMFPNVGAVGNYVVSLGKKKNNLNSKYH